MATLQARFCCFVGLCRINARYYYLECLGSWNRLWALAPRLDILGILGLWLLVPAVTRGINNLGSSKVALSSTLAIAIVLMVYSIFNDPQEINGEIKTPQPETAQAVPGVAERLACLWSYSLVNVILH